jgi:3',5'-cyclic AMP phosphodiesterase CpdA
MMRLSAAALLSAGVWPGVLAAQDVAVPEIQFICVNDLHYTDENCAPFFKAMIERMKQSQPGPQLLLVAGDLCENGTRAQLGGIRDILKTLGMTTRVVVGNHDWANQTDRTAYEDLWPDSLNYTLEHGGWQFVGLDSSDGVKFEKVSVLKPTLDWVDQTLPKLDRKRPMVVFTHFPLGADVKYRLGNADELLDRFREFNLRGVFNGHFHSFTQRAHGEYAITTDKCCSFRKNNHDGTPEKGFFSCRVRDGKLIREFVRVA